MRKFIAILMLAVFLFNLAGYSFLFDYYIGRADQTIVKKLDANQYSEANLTEIKIKLNMPYLSDWRDYERYDGGVEVNGVHYNYVKRKVSQDTLYLLCLPNELKTELYKVKNDYAAKANDLPSEKQNKNPGLKKGVVLEGGRIISMEFVFSLYSIQIGSEEKPFSQDITDTYLPSAGEPPECTIS